MRRSTHIQYIAHDVGNIFFVVALISLIPYLIIVWYQEWDQILPYTTVPMAFVVLGILLSRVPYDPKYTPPLSVAMLMVAMLWLLSALIGSLPFLLHAQFTLTDALFEAMSGFTGTGMTLVEHIAELPKTLLFWRSYMEWIGGIGIMAIGITMQTRSRLSQSRLMRSEGSGGESLGPNVVTTAKIFLKIYVGLTLFFSCLFLTSGISYWDALNIAMCSVGTGGFTMHTQGIAYYDNALLEMLIIPAMFCGSIPFKLYVLFGFGQFTAFIRNRAFQGIAACITVGSLITTADLHFQQQYPLTQAIREGVFYSVSAITNTGYQNADLTMWFAPPVLVLMLLMMMSGSIGSTAGGIKIDRFILAARGMNWLISQYFVKKSSYLINAYKGHRIADRDARFDLVRNMVFIVMYLFTLFVATVVALHISPPTIPLHAMIFDLVSATSNVGINFGYLTPGSPISLKWLYIFLMWVGRLEIFPFIILAAGFLYGFDYRARHDTKKKTGK